MDMKFLGAYINSATPATAEVNVIFILSLSTHITSIGDIYSPAVSYVYVIGPNEFML